MEKYRARVTVREIKGECHIHKVGDTYIVEEEGQSFRFEKGERFCTYALSSMLPLFSALSKELERADWRAAENLIFQCPDPGPERGGGGTVYFEIKREKV